MVEFDYRDGRNLLIHPDWINDQFNRSGLNRKAFESAARAAALSPCQATTMLDIYTQAREWLEAAPVTPPLPPPTIAVESKLNN